jgi:hypothetical protein
MKVRITVLTENDKPLPPVEERPKEEQIVKAWQTIFDALSLFGEDKAVVEKAEYVEVQDGK